MRLFLIKSGLVGVLVLAVHVGVAYWAGGHADAYYVRYATPKQRSLILGTSRAAQGVVPEVLNAGLAGVMAQGGVEGPVFNFAFTNLHSPYGEAYLRAIRRKLEDGTRNGLFILSVDPWSLSVEVGRAGDTSRVREMGLPIQTLECMSCRPNWEYLMQEYPKMWGHILLQPWLSPELYLHEDGWLEVDVPMDIKSVAKRTKEKIAQYEGMARQYQASAYRMRALERTIAFLKEHGLVVLVRLPVGEGLMEIERGYWPGFSGEMQEVAKVWGCAFEDFTASSLSWQFTDGNHLYRESGRALSVELGRRVREYLKE